MRGRGWAEHSRAATGERPLLSAPRGAGDYHVTRCPRMRSEPHRVAGPGGAGRFSCCLPAGADAWALPRARGWNLIPATSMCLNVLNLWERGRAAPRAPRRPTGKPSERHLISTLPTPPHAAPRRSTPPNAAPRRPTSPHAAPHRPTPRRKHTIGQFVFVT